MNGPASVTLVAGDATGYDLDGVPPSELAAAFARYGEVVERSVHVYGGVRPPMRAERDDFLAVFDTAHAAVRACIDIHTAARAGPPCVTPRIAMHTGEASKRDDGGYVGPAVVVCDRLRRAGEIGQILMTASTHALVARDRALDATFEDISPKVKHVADGPIYAMHPSDRLPEGIRGAEMMSSEVERAGWNALSAIEHRVVGLVAEGLTNRQIGERLELSPRTVQAHLARIFRKLEVTSRSHLAARAGTMRR